MRYEKTKWEEMDYAVGMFLEELGHTNDGFWDEGVCRAQPYKMQDGDEPVGFFALKDWDGDVMMTAFYLPRQYMYRAQTIFADVCREFGVKRVMAPSNDELLLCLAMETMRAQGGSFEMQAYNLTFGIPSRPAEFSKECFVPVQEEEYEEMHRLTEDQWNDPATLAQCHMYKVVSDGVTMGYGAVMPRTLDKRCADIGNYVLPEHRRKGVGRSILIQLSYAAISAGYKPTAGCWYYNHNSIRTLTSAGYIPQSRLLNIVLNKA